MTIEGAKTASPAMIVEARRVFLSNVIRFVPRVDVYRD
jgi:hypothetical protein